MEVRTEWRAVWIILLPVLPRLIGVRAQFQSDLAVRQMELMCVLILQI